MIFCLQGDLEEKYFFDFGHSEGPFETKIPKLLVGLKFGCDDKAWGKGNSGKIQYMVTLVSCEYAH